ncbi:MAG: hypothetical protein NT105_09630 [Verrucomicrobia bacterium]|nr:hypothetical protein [Verrucomicrobiota bacterium]
MGRPLKMDEVCIAGTAKNPASIGPFTNDFSDPPTQSEMRAFRD